MERGQSGTLVPFLFLDPFKNSLYSYWASFTNIFFRFVSNDTCAQILPGFSLVQHCGLSSGSNVTFVLINTNMSWTEAQSYCREHHTDLASVRNLDENQKIKELISGLTVWIGLSRETWKWTDGRNSSFRFWKKNPPEPNNNYEKETCVAAYFEDSGRWEDWPCHYKRASICYRVINSKLCKR
uniref:C-type lectin domain-containing protein n=1 Tax=Labrus bergylta TaxID=56723 RepID=A0A3Q3G5R4_9LABR